MMNQNTTRYFALVGCAILFGVTIATQTSLAETGKKAKKTFKWEGEEIFYSAEVSGTEAARASIRVGQLKKAKSGASYIPLSAKAITHGFFAKSFPVNDNGDTFIHPQTGLPIKADKYIREDGEERMYKVRYEPSKYSAKVLKKVGKKERKFDRAVPKNTYDAFSWMYALRAKPLKEKDKYIFYVYDGWKLSRLHIKVVGREKVWTPIGYYPSVKLDIDREILNSRWEGEGKKRKLKLTTRTKPSYFATLHMSDNTERIPVRVFITSKMGDVDFKIIKYVPPKK